MRLEMKGGGCLDEDLYSWTSSRLEMKGCMLENIGKYIFF